MKKILYTIILCLLSNLVLAQTTTENYIKSTSYQIKTNNGVHSTTGVALTPDDKVETITYYDGLGRPIQSIAKQAGGQKQDIITPVIYDEYGRQSRDYLPYSRIGSSLDLDPSLLPVNGEIPSLNAQYLNKYPDELDAATPNPYSQKELEASPLNRVLKQAAPGKDWMLGNGHEIEMQYLTNDKEEVRHYTVHLDKYTTSLNVVTYAPSLLSENGYYAKDQLYKTIIKDENHDGSNSKNHTTEEFKNKQGQVILRRTYNEEITHDTYYVYDTYGNLTFVLPPKSEAHADKPNATELDELCYQYKYDDRNRLVEKKIPGKGWEYIVYNKLDQPVMTQDQNLKGQYLWLVTKYDAFGRVAYTALKNIKSSRVALQGTINNDSPEVPQYESKVTSGTGAYNTYYTSNARPTGVDEILTINYYDNYNFDIAGGISESSYGVTPINNVKGLATGSKVRVLDTNSWITSTIYYDEKSNPIYGYSKNDYLETVDKVKSEFTFDGKITETTTIHDKAVNGLSLKTLTIIDKYTYDHANRVLTHKQNINDAALDEVIVSNDYDDLGQLLDKEVGGKENAGRLQHVDFKYNIRGWLKSINDPDVLGNDVFAFKINYNNTQLSLTPNNNNITTPLFNGNISEVIWKTKNDEDNPLSGVDASDFKRGYSYSYDALNRINNGWKAQLDGYTSTGPFLDYALHGVEYDKNGNIIKLNRKGNYGYNSIDELSYSYDSGNKLISVSDSAPAFNKDEGFKDGYTGATDYAYDANGNMVVDKNKNIERIDYNHLNLPTQVNIADGTINYVYDATGVKLKKIVSTGATTDYTGNFIYENDVLQMFSNPEGYAEQLSGSKNPVFGYTYQYKDHLGNIRLSYKHDDSIKSTNIDDDFNSGTDDWSMPNPGSIDNTNNKLNINLVNKWQSTSKYLTIEPNVPLRIEFDFENGTMDKPVFFVRERINGVWEPGADRDKIWDIQDGHHVMELTLTGDYVRLYFEKANGIDNGTLTSCALDNFKLTQNGLEIIEENNYYPFGLKHKGYNNLVSPSANSIASKFKYNGKELDESFGYGMYEYEARHYDAPLARFVTIDPLAEDYLFQSTYAYAVNDPVRYIDKLGMGPDDWVKSEGSDTWVWREDITSKEQATSEGLLYGGKTKDEVIKNWGHNTEDGFDGWWNRVIKKDPNRGQKFDWDSFMEPKLKAVLEKIQQARKKRLYIYNEMTKNMTEEQKREFEFDWTFENNISVDFLNEVPIRQYWSFKSDLVVGGNSYDVVFRVERIPNRRFFIKYAEFDANPIGSNKPYVQGKIDWTNQIRLVNSEKFVNGYSNHIIFRIIFGQKGEQGFDDLRKLKD